MTPFCDIIGHKHSQVFYDLDIGDFGSLVKRFNPTNGFVRFKMSPRHSPKPSSPFWTIGDYFNKSPENWEFQVLQFDEIRLPEWFDTKRAEEQARVMLADFLENRVLVGQKIDKLTSGRWFLKDCAVGKIAGDTEVMVVSGDSVIGVVSGKSKIHRVDGNVKIASAQGHCIFYWIGGNTVFDSISEDCKIRHQVYLDLRVPEKQTHQFNWVA